MSCGRGEGIWTNGNAEKVGVGCSFPSLESNKKIREKTGNQRRNKNLDKKAQTFKHRRIATEHLTVAIVRNATNTKTTHDKRDHTNNQHGGETRIGGSRGRGVVVIGFQLIDERLVKSRISFGFASTKRRQEGKESDEKADYDNNSNRKRMAKKCTSWQESEEVDQKEDSQSVGKSHLRVRHNPGNDHRNDE
jgi:hypothetical protein